MKQYLTQEQTAKLIELGFEKPKGWYIDGVTNNIKLYVNIDENPMMFNYSIGELLSFLPENIAKENEMPSTLNVSLMDGEWCVQYADFLGADFEFCNTELVDALYDMLVKLKEERVI